MTFTLYRLTPCILRRIPREEINTVQRAPYRSQHTPLCSRTFLIRSALAFLTYLLVKNRYNISISGKNIASLSQTTNNKNVIFHRVCHTLPKMMYDTSDNLVGVEPKKSTRRALTQEEGTGSATAEGRRRKFEDCTACEEAWHALCEAVPSVCDLVDYGAPFDAAAASSASSACGTFGGACSKYEASEACQDHCTAEGPRRNDVPGMIGMRNSIAGRH